MNVLLPNPANLIMTVNGRTYMGTSGVPVSNVPDQDASILEANGWLLLPAMAASMAGTPTNDAAASGVVGEVQSTTVLVASAVNMSTGNAVNAVSMLLPTGDWNVSGVAQYHGGAGTVPSDILQGISTVSATIPAAGAFTYDYIGIAIPDDPAYGTPVVPVKLAVPSLVYLVAKSDFSVSTLVVYGQMTARRVR